MRSVYCVKVSYGNALCLGQHPTAFLIPVCVPCPCLCWQLQNLCTSLSGAGSWKQEVPVAGRCPWLCGALHASCLRSPAGWAVSPSCAQCQEGSVEASSKAHWEGLGLALGYCGSDVPFREAALISSGSVSPSVPGHAGPGTFGISRIHLSHGTRLQLLFSSSEGTSPWFRRGVGTFCHSCKKLSRNFCLQPGRKVPVVGSFIFRRDGKKSHHNEKKKSNFLPLVLGLKLPVQCQAAASSFP